ncbi:MFS transporter, partial [Ramlibacter sp.]|uniref:MFS transporter n=1 Tax=Ramlibacter sp. TaxID=1917967 RepID=UPI0017C1A751
MLKVVAVYVILILHFMDMSVANIALVPIALDLGIEAYRSQWIIVAFGIGIVAAIPAVPPLVKWMGGRAAFSAVLATSLAALVLCGSSSNFWILLAGRLLQGLASGAVLLLAQKQLLAMMKDAPALAMSLWISALAVSPVVGPVAGALVVDAVGWHWVFLGQVPILLLCIFVIRAELGVTPERGGPPPSALVVLALTGVLLFGQLALEAFLGKAQDAGTARWLYLGAAAVSLVVLRWHTHARAAPLFDWALLRNGPFAAYLFLNTMQGALLVMTAVIYTLWMQLQLKLPLPHVAGVLASTGLIAGVLSPLIGKYAQPRLQPVMVMAGVLLYIASFLIAARLTLDAQGWALVLPRVVCGFALALLSPGSYLMIAKLPEPRRLEANSLALFSRLIGINVLLIAGVAIARLLADAAGRDARAASLA